MTSIEDKLAACKLTRKIAARSLVKVLKDLLPKNQPISEVNLRDKLLEELREHKTIFPDGWYIPPPHGVTVLFGTDKNIERVNPKSLRLEEFWPRQDICLNKKEGIAFLYASPVDKKTGIIGDFGLTLYFGKNKKIQNHLKNCLKINQEIFNFATIGIRFSKLYAFTKNLLKSKGFVSDLLSVSDPTKTNIGHTIPAVLEDWSGNELKIFKQKKWNKILNVISKKRVFINSAENLGIKNGMAFTIEPRPQIVGNYQIPAVYFHTIAIFRENGEKELLTDFDEIFRLVGMDYMF